MVDALKFDEGKPQHHLLIDEFIDEMIKVREMGSAKYEKWDWLNGLAFSKYQDAIKRHLKAFNSGEDIDPEDGGRHHMAHIAISAMFLYTFQMTGTGDDDRHGTKADRLLERLNNAPSS
jgi:hypothetical protein